MDIKSFWFHVLSQNKDALRGYFCDDAVIRWHCTNEQFTVEEYLQTNCDYPGSWEGEIERTQALGCAVILAGRVYPPDRSASFHVVSFLRLHDDRIIEMDEYWASDGKAPAWRKQMKIGKPIR